MSDGTPESGATEGPMVQVGPLTDRDALDDAVGRAYDMLVEESQRLREHVCLHPFHLDVGAEFLDAMRCFAFAVDVFTAASEAVEHAAQVDHDAPAIAEPAAEPMWRAGFAAGALAQLDWMVAYALGRGWSSTAAAIRMTSPVAPPATFEEAADVRA